MVSTILSEGAIIFLMKSYRRGGGKNRWVQFSQFYLTRVKLIILGNFQPLTVRLSGCMILLAHWYPCRSVRRRHIDCGHVIILFQIIIVIVVVQARSGGGLSRFECHRNDIGAAAGSETDGGGSVVVQRTAIATTGRRDVTLPTKRPQVYWITARSIEPRASWLRNRK